MHRCFLTVVLTVAFVGWAGAVQADPVIYLNDIEPSFVTLSQDFGSDGHIQSADDFELGGGADWQVTDVHWLGGELSEGGFGFGAVITDFRIIFYADDDGVPTGSTLANPTSTAIAVREVTAGVENAGAEGDLEGLLVYWADIDPVILSGGTTYWIAIQALSGDNEALWLWATDLDIEADVPGFGNSVVGTSDSELPYWSNPLTVFSDEEIPEGSGFELAFALTGNQVPAPGAALLAMLGMPAIGWIKRRFA